MQRIPRRRYTDDFKSQAVALAESIGPAKAARQLDLSVKTLANWRTAARAGKALSTPSRQPVSELESELARLRAENATLKMEREILKKRPRALARPSGRLTPEQGARILDALAVAARVTELDELAARCAALEAGRLPSGGYEEQGYVSA